MNFTNRRNGMSVALSTLAFIAIPRPHEPNGIRKERNRTGCQPAGDHGGMLLRVEVQDGAYHCFEHGESAKASAVPIGI